MTNRITHLSVRPIAGATTNGLKGLTFADDLGGVDVFAGVNGSGKTTRVLCLLGAIHGLAQTTTDKTRPYLGGPANGVQVEVRTTGGKWTRDLGVVNPSANAHKVATREAQAIIGDPVVSWDLKDWSSGTDGDRRKLLAAIARAGGAVEVWTAQDAQTKLQAFMDGTDSGPEIIADLVSYHPTAEDAGLWLDAGEVWAQDAAKDARKGLREAEAVLKARKDEASDAPEGDPSRDLTDARATVARLITARDEVGQHAARLTRATEEVDEVKRRGLEAKALPDMVEPSRDDVAAAESDDLNARDALRAPVPALPSAPAIDPALGEAVKVADAKVEETKAVRNAAFDALQRAHNAIRTAQGREDQAKASGARLAELRIQAQAPCRHCGEPDPLGALVDVAAPEALPDMAPMRAASIAADEAHVKASNELSAAYATQVHATQALSRAQGAASASVADAADRAARIMADRREAAQSASVRLSMARDRLSTDTRRYSNEADRRRAALAQLRIDYVAAAGRLSALKTATVDAVDPEAIATAEARVAGLQAEADRHRDHRRAVESLRKAGEALTVAEVKRKACDALIEGIRAVRMEQAAACYGPVEKAARSLLDGAWDDVPQPYLAGPDDYGATVVKAGKRVRIRFEALSEAESRVTAAALVYALAVVANQPCRLVLIDGLDVVQSDHRGPLLSRLARAREDGLVDSVIVTYATSGNPKRAALERSDIDVPGVTIHNLKDPK